MELLHTLISHLATLGLIPEEVTDTRVNANGTYLQALPTTPAKAYCASWYDTGIATGVVKQVGVFRYQFIFRNPSQGEALSEVTTLWEYFLQQGCEIQDISSDTWVIFDIHSGPIALGQDESGNYLYSLNVPVKANTF
ncbi:MAG: hypothetical protein R3Y58_01845 [Eubacteriales bacterium]